MDDARFRSLWPLTFWEAVSEALAAGAIIVIVIAFDRSRGEPGVLTMALLALLIYVFVSILARVNPQAIVKYPLALLAPDEARRLILGNRAFLALVKAEVVGLFATMLASGLDRVPHGQMTAPLAAVLIGFTTVILGTVLISVITLRPRP